MIFTLKKYDIMDMLLSAKHDINQARTSYFNKGIVTEESWNASPSSRVSFHKSKIPMLKAAGVMKDPKDFEYGWHFPNVYYSKVDSELNAINKSIGEMLNCLENYYLIPKTRTYTDEELSAFEVIEGGGRDSFLVAWMKGGKFYA